MSESGDGGDSARAHGIVDCFDHYLLQWKNHGAGKFVLDSGLAVRHPTQAPWNNPLNFSRDQLMCLVAGLSVNAALMLLNTHKKRFWFCQNIERDWPGTRKRPYPHKMTGGDPVDEGKWRMFDYADPLLPHHVLHLYRCAKIKPPLFIKVFGTILFWLSIRFVSKKIDSEQNQLQCMVKTAGQYWIDLYKKCNPMWKLQTKYYWNDERNCPEIYNIIFNGLDNITVG